MASLKRACPCDAQIVGQDSVESLPQYEWDTLPTGTHFRVFRLHASPDGQPLSGSLLSIDLDAADGRYLALSYAWDGQTPKHAIRCDDRQLRVTCNLFSALSRMRSGHTNLMIFADAISINQGSGDSDLVERASQVRLMNEIYTRASKVIINISEDPGQELKDLFDCLADMPANVWKRWRDDGRWGASADEEGGVPGTGFLKYLKAQSKESPVLAALEVVLSSSWQGRLWMIQEYVLARHAEVMIGKHTMPAGRFWKLNDRLADVLAFAIGYEEAERTLRLLSKSVRLTSFAESMTMLREEHIQDASKARAARYMTLARVMYHTAPFATTDLRDRIHGVLGIITGSDMSAFAVDYTEPVTELSLRLSRLLVCEGELGALLQLLACRDDSDHPSWAIDLRRSEARPDLAWYKLPLRHEYEKYFKAGGAPSHPRPEVGLSRDGRRLSVRGEIIDSIGITTRPAPPVFLATQSPGTAHSVPSDFNWIVESYNIIKAGVAEGSCDPSSLRTDFIHTATAGVSGVDINLDLLTDTGLAELDDCTKAAWVLPPIEPLTDAEKRRRKEITMLSQEVRMGCLAQRMGVTGNGKLCKVPENSRPGDEIAVIRDMGVFFVLRQTDHGYKLIGNAHLHAIDPDEALEPMEEYRIIELC